MINGKIFASKAQHTAATRITTSHKQKCYLPGLPLKKHYFSLINTFGM